MLHTIEDVIRRIDVMKDKAIELHRVRNQYSELSGKNYDKDIANSLLDDIQSLALGIAMDKQGDEIKTEMDYKKL
jgi:cell division FtsZ-interacting protein ZapD